MGTNTAKNKRNRNSDPHPPPLLSDQPFIHSCILTHCCRKQSCHIRFSMLLDSAGDAWKYGPTSRLLSVGSGCTLVALMLKVACQLCPPLLRNNAVADSRSITYVSESSVLKLCCLGRYHLSWRCGHS